MKSSLKTIKNKTAKEVKKNVITREIYHSDYQDVKMSFLII